MQYLKLRPSQVILDSANPRLPDGTSSDREAINRLLDDGAEALVALARDLAKSGEANPAELPIAIKDRNKYLILEGNRRFAALKLLKDPALADDEEHQKSFRRAAALGTPPQAVLTLVMPSRETADHWIVLRHTGENGGVGIKRWSAAQTATHRRRANKTIDSGTLRSIILADELQEAYEADGEMIELIRQVRRGKLTNIGRFFSPDVLSALHFTLNTEETNSLRPKALYVRHSAEQLRSFFAWALSYISANPVDAYKNARIRQSLLDSVAHLMPSHEDAAIEPFRIVDRTPASVGDLGPLGSTSTQSDDEVDAYSDDDEADDEVDAYGRPTGSSVREGQAVNDENSRPDTTNARVMPRGSETKPERYLLQGLKLPNHPPRVQHLLKECRSLDLEAYPGIACVMMRIIVELSVSSQPALALSGSGESSPLRVKVTNMLKYLDPDIENPRTRDKDLEQAYLETTQLGVQYLNGFLHNSAVYPDPHLARRFSSAFRPLLVRVDEKL